MTHPLISIGLALGMASLPVDGVLDDYLFYGGAIDEAVEISGFQGESPRDGDAGPHQPAESFPWSPSWDGTYDYVVEPSFVYDPLASFCPDEVTVEPCIPDTFPMFDAEDEEDSGPTPQQVLGAISAQMERDAVTLPVVPARVQHQPEGGEVLVNMETIFYTSAQPQNLYTSLLGFPVTIEVVPSWFEWDFGDDSGTLTTTDGGAPYPNHTISHTYRSAGDNIVTLRTTWNARFRVEGLSGWIPVSGQPVTIDQVGPIESVTKRSRLVHVGTSR